MGRILQRILVSHVISVAVRAPAVEVGGILVGVWLLLLYSVVLRLKVVHSMMLLENCRLRRVAHSLLLLEDCRVCGYWLMRHIVVRVGSPLMLRLMVDRPLLRRLSCISRGVVSPLLLEHVKMSKVHSRLLLLLLVRTRLSL